jgi:CHC2 zinc finger
MSAPHVTEFLSRLAHVRRSGAGWMACCPVHADRTPSLSVGIGDEDRILVQCHGCGARAEAIVAALGLAMGDLFRDHRAPRVLVPVAPVPQAFFRILNVVDYHAEAAAQPGCDPVVQTQYIAQEALKAIERLRARYWCGSDADWIRLAQLAELEADAEAILAALDD